MIEIIGAVIIAVGTILLIRGLTEKIDLPYEHNYHYELEDELSKEKKEESKRDVEKETKVGGVVLIGPIPIVFGNSKYAVYALILAIVLMLISIFLMFSYSL